MTDTETTGTMTTTHWDEQPWAEPEGGPKLSATSTTSTYDGAIVGEAALRMVMFYEPKAEGDDSWGKGTFIAFEHLTGSVGGREGSFVLRQVGSFEGAHIATELTVEPGSGTGDLAGLTGTGTYQLSLGDQAATYTFEYDFGS